MSGQPPASAASGSTSIGGLGSLLRRRKKDVPVFSRASAIADSDGVIQDRTVLLFQYIRFGAMGKLKKSLERKKIDPNARLLVEVDPREPTTLCAAVSPELYKIPNDEMLARPVTEKMRNEIVHYLLKRGANLDLPDRVGMQPLHLALIAKKHEWVTEFVAKQKDLNHFDEQGLSPMILAFEAGETRAFDYVRLMLKHGAQLDAQGCQGTALHWAVTAGRKDVVEFLLREGAKVDVRGRLQRTPFLTAISEGQDGIAEVLALNHANLEAVDSLGRNAAHIAAIKGSQRTLRLVLAQHIPVDRRDREANMPLHYAVAHTVALVEMLLEAQIDVDALGAGDATALHVAASKGNEPVCLLLMRAHATVDALDAAGRTPLFAAIARRHVGVVELMLQRDAAMVLHRERGTDRTPLHLACSLACEPIVRMLVSKGADINAIASDGRPPLHELLWEGIAAPNATTLAAFLIKQGAHVNAAGRNGDTALHLVVHKDAAELAEFLLARAGADVHASNADGKTPLHCATSVRMAKVLLQHGATLEARDRAGRRPLHEAAANNRELIVQFLVKSGAQVAVEDDNWCSPRVLATLPSIRSFLEKFELAQPVASTKSPASATGAQVPSKTRKATTVPRLVPLVDQLLGDFESALNDQEFSDVTLVIENHPLYAHKAILVARCAYFRRMFSLEQQKANVVRGQELRIIVNNSRYDVMLALLRYLYSLTVDISDDIAIELAVLATKFGVAPLAELAIEHVQRTYMPETAVPTLLKAYQLKCEPIVDSAIRYISLHFRAVSHLQDVAGHAEGGQLMMRIMEHVHGAAPTAQDLPDVDGDAPRRARPAALQRAATSVGPLPSATSSSPSAARRASDSSPSGSLTPRAATAAAPTPPLRRVATTAAAMAASSAAPRSSRASSDSSDVLSSSSDAPAAAARKPAATASSPSAPTSPAVRPTPPRATSTATAAASPAATKAPASPVVAATAAPAKAAASPTVRATSGSPAASPTLRATPKTPADDFVPPKTDDSSASRLGDRFRAMLKSLDDDDDLLGDDDDDDDDGAVPNGHAAAAAAAADDDDDDDDDDDVDVDSFVRSRPGSAAKRAAKGEANGHAPASNGYLQPPHLGDLDDELAVADAHSVDSTGSVEQRRRTVAVDSVSTVESRQRTSAV